MNNFGEIKMGKREKLEEKLKLPTLHTKIDLAAQRFELGTPVMKDERSNRS